ncbi:restriction endonuclease subunit S [Salmonella enterica]|uniref:Restriction endonuclease subunit S n=1 Tax=Salmonella enterica subsp. enterica serovar 43:a:1,7 TaxID=2500155 RepID=A0A3T0AQ27_SALET|nr:restriction endonuclease subunit S [Salmonella enterica subsp. enterica serovar 43:a:1,7]EAZ0394295.1 restriction endonuclease subunit S [Salmonella enterica]ECI2734910.1 restriction endonuclease subunit S [Salmonella enterica subsp. enterica]EGI6152082.1 restriction endonuclease subunit S [Salmonella enterica subsp. enterica serovar Louga]EDW2196360.1 restriction endonuclease subunit S [Salmonella enterica subsp. enterica]
MSGDYLKIPNGWYLVTLDKISNVITKGATPTTYGFDWTDENSGIPFLRSECVTSNGFNDKGMSFISLEAHNAMERSKIVPGDILMTITGNIGRIAVLPDRISEANINQHIACISIRDEYCSEYVFQSLHLEYYSRYYERILTGQAYPQISLKQVRETPILMPPHEEQKEISKILSCMDEKIKLIEQKIIETEKLKNGMMQKLFSEGYGVIDDKGEWHPHKKYLELSGETSPESWIKTVLSKVITVKSGDSLSKSKMEEGSIPVFGGNGISGYHSSANFNTKKIVIGRVGEYCGTVYQTPEKSWITDNALYVHEKKIELNDDFLYYLLEYKKLNQYANRNAQPLISGKTLERVNISIPSSIDEQLIISKILLIIDKKLTLLRQHKSETQLLKKGLMQKLLTGEWRVPLDCDEEEAA